jgi:hypothetical protein
VAYGRFFSAVPGGNNFSKDMLKTDIIHCLDKCELSLEDVKIDYNKRYYPMGAYVSSVHCLSFLLCNKIHHAHAVYSVSSVGVLLFVLVPLRTASEMWALFLADAWMYHIVV